MQVDVAEEVGFVSLPHQPRAQTSPPGAGPCGHLGFLQVLSNHSGIYPLSSPLPPPTGLASFLKAPNPRAKLFAYHPGQCQGQEQRLAIVTEPAPSTKSRTWLMLRRIFGRKDSSKARPSRSLLSLSFKELFPDPPLPWPRLHPFRRAAPVSFPASPGPALPRRPAPKATGVWRQPWFCSPADGGN